MLDTLTISPMVSLPGRLANRESLNCQLSYYEFEPRINSSQPQTLPETILNQAIRHQLLGFPVILSIYSLPWYIGYVYNVGGSKYFSLAMQWPMLHRSATYDSCSMGSGIWSTRQDTCCHSCQLFSQDGFKSEMKSFNQEKSKDCPQGSTSEERHHEPLGSNVLLSLPAPPKTTVSVRNLTLVAKNGENKLTRKIKRIRNKQGTEFKTEDSHRAQEHVDDGGDYQHDLEAAEQDRGQKVILNDVSCECYPHEMLAM